MGRHSTRTAISLVALALALAAPAAAEPRTSSDLLLPYFEVGLDEKGKTTLFALGNAYHQEVQVRVSVDTNWGIPVLAMTLTLGPGQVQTVNLRDWIVNGALPNRNLGPDVLAHLQAGLAGEPSPKDGLYYGQAVEPGLAVGSISFRVPASGGGRPDSLWGDYFWADPDHDFASGELLVDIDRVLACQGLCDRHLVRFLEGGAFDGTELVIWTPARGNPSPTPQPKFLPARVSGQAFYDEPGAKFDERILDLLPTQVIALSELDLAEPFGWIDIVTEEEVYVGVRHRAEGRFTVAVQSWCMEEPPEPPQIRPRPAVELQKLTAGSDADLPPGPALQIGTEVVWEYVVHNTGNVRLTEIVVTDNRGVVVTCPRSGLSAGQSMTCTGSGTVAPGQYGNVGTVTANPPSGSVATDSDPSHYLGVEFILGEPAIALEKLVNGQDADSATGPTISQGSPVTWSYLVTNTGGVGLTGVTVADSDPVVSVSCPRTSLDVGGSMICTASGTAVEGQYSNVGAVSASGGGKTVSASDPAFYFGLPQLSTDAPAIEIEKLTNGYDADGVASAPQLLQGDAVVWTYVVTNTGNIALSDVAVSDDQGVEVSCPRTTLEPGEQMLCTGSGTAVASEECYENVGTVVATPPQGDNVTDSDPSHYCAEEVVGEASIHIEKYTNGADADVAPGPALTEGDAVQWVYVVTNTGDVTLTGVTVTDDQGVSVTCSGGQPFVLEPAQTKTCFGNGVAGIGQYANVGTASGTPEGGGDAVGDSDPSHYFGEEALAEPEIDLEKKTNGSDADTPTGPVLTVGDPVTWTYLVTNTGDVPLTGIAVSDDQLGAIPCPKAVLDPGESMTCSASGTAEAGQYANVGTASGTPQGGGDAVTDSDPSHYLGEEAGGDQGCTPGYWKNHPDSWPATGYTTAQTVQSVFGNAATWPAIGGATLLQALDFSSGSSVEGKAAALVRAAVAALLDAAHPGVDYPRTPASVIADVDAALASQDADTIEALKNALDADNNLGCPLN